MDSLSGGSGKGGTEREVSRKTARYLHTAIGVQQFPPGVSNNSLRIHCAVNPLAKTPLYESRSQNLNCATFNTRLCCTVFRVCCIAPPRSARYHLANPCHSSPQLPRAHRTLRNRLTLRFADLNRSALRSKRVEGACTTTARWLL